MVSARSTLLAGLSVLVACAGCSNVTAASDPAVSRPDTAVRAVVTPEPTLTATGAVPDPAGPTTASSTDGGCTELDTAPPADASIAPTADLDRDGRVDELWLGRANGQQLLGVRTAAGGSFATPWTSGGSAATAVGQTLDPGTSVVLLSTGATAYLFAVADCRIEPSTDAARQQVTFDVDRAVRSTGTATGVGCAPATSEGGQAGGLALFALGVRDSDDTGDRTRAVIGTRVELSDGGRRATRAVSADLVTGASADAVAAAHTVTCGDQTQGPTAPAG